MIIFINYTQEQQSLQRVGLFEDRKEGRVLFVFKNYCEAYLDNIWMMISGGNRMGLQIYKFAYKH